MPKDEKEQPSRGRGNAPAVRRPLSRTNTPGGLRSGSSTRMANTPSKAQKQKQGAAAAGAQTFFWRAKTKTTLHIAPRGAVVGEVDEGTVIEESDRFIDVFDDMWLAVVTEDEDVVWLHRYADGPMCDTRDEVWEPVFEAPEGQAQDGGAAQQPAQEEGDQQQHQQLRISEAQLAAARPVSPVGVHEPLLSHNLDGVTREWSFFTAFWNGALFDDKSTNWNDEYQCAIEDILYDFDKSRDEQALRQALADVVSGFSDTAMESAAVIVHEFLKTNASRTIKAHSPCGVGVYFHKNILFRVCIDPSGAYGGDDKAAKVAAQEHRAHVFLSSVAPEYLVSVPLKILFSFHGYRIMATSIPPVHETETAVYKDGAPVVNEGVSARLLNKVLETLAQALRLKPHEVAVAGSATAPKNTTHFPQDVQVHAGRDKRLYLLNYGRLCPPMAPTKKYTRYDGRVDGLTRRLRPETFLNVSRVLSPDAYCPGACTPEDNAEILNISEWLRRTGLETCAKVFGFTEPSGAAEEDTPTKCVSCKTEIGGGMLRFHVCSKLCGSCCICPQCHLNIMTAACSTDGDGDAKARKLLEAVKGGCRCDGGVVLRDCSSFVMEPDVSTVLHAQGVNLRYLGYVHGMVALKARHCTGHYVEIEMVARAAKSVLRRKLRQAIDDDAKHKVCVDFYMTLVQQDGEEVERFWSEQLGPYIQQYFDIFVPFNTSAMSIELVCRRVAELTGLELTDDSLRSLATEKPFVQLNEPRPVMKMTRIPMLVEKVGDGKAELDRLLEDVLLFWINQSSPDHGTVPRYITKPGE